MAESTTTGKFHFEQAARGEAVVSTPLERTPFRILVLGDFSGRTGLGVRESLSERNPREVDCENLDDVLQTLKVSLELKGTSESANVRFDSMADFHPDKLLERAAAVSTTYGLRQQLLNADTFPHAAGVLTALLETDVSSAVPENRKGPPPPSIESDQETLQRLLGRAPQRTRCKEIAREIVQELIHQSLAPAATSSLEPIQKELLPAVDLFLSRQVKGLLQHPEFQSLEAAWRGIDFLVRNLDTNEMLGVYLLDISFEELADDLNPDVDLGFSALHHWIIDIPASSHGGVPWAVVLGNYYFSPAQPEHNELLARLARICSAGKTIFLAGAAPSVLTLAERRATPESWLELRLNPAAPSVGLLFPRFLLRLPYGSKTDPIEAFEFEEMPERPRLLEYLWGNAVFVAGRLLGQSFSCYGWDFTPGAIDQCDGLPVHTFREDGESRMTPCGELWLSDAMVEQLERVGVMTLQSVKSRGAVRLSRFHSLSSPLTALRGRWST